MSSTFIFPEVRVVEASAGSGKTYTLARRYIRFLFDAGAVAADVPLRNILAITFTTKATFEMKERILEFLKKIALGSYSSGQEKKDLLSVTGMDETAARERAFLVVEYLLRNYHFFQVQTIDSFINALLSACAFKVNLSAGFRIQDEYASFIAYSLDLLIEQAHEDRTIRELFRVFIDHYLYLENRTGWLPKNDILSLMRALFGHNNTYAEPFRKAGVAGDDLPALKKVILTHLRRLWERLPDGVNKRFVTTLERFLTVHQDGFDIDDVPDWFSREVLPLNKGYEPPDDVASLWDVIRRDLGRLCELEAYYLYDPYVDIFRHMMCHFVELSRREDVLFLQELNKQARMLFDGEGLTVEELYYRMATRFRHYLIDEFQDTSLLQWRNLEPMIEEALSTGGSLFYVGDKKQAIYRFRGGEVSLFDAVRRRFRDFNLCEERLQTNWRSWPQVVAFNNRVFDPDNLRRFLYDIRSDAHEFSEQDMEDIVGTFADARQESAPGKEGGYVRIREVGRDDADDSDGPVREELIVTLREAAGRYNGYGQLAVLARDNRDVEYITSWLLAEDIPVASDKTLNIRQNARIKELVSLLSFLQSPLDDCAFASVILGDMFLMAAGMTREDVESFIFEKRRDPDRRLMPLYKEFQRLFPEIWERLLADFLCSVGFVPLYEFVISILDRFQVLNLSSGDQGFVMKFLEVVKDREEDDVSVEGFLKWFADARDEDLYVTVEKSDAVRVLTIHKSKGLEFHAVVIPFLTMDLTVGAGRGGRSSYVLRTDDGGLSLLRMKKKYRTFSSRLDDIYRCEYKRTLADELNTLYVAFTRARCELHLFVPERTGRAANPVRLLIPGEQTVYGEPASCVVVARKETAPLVEIPPASFREWIHHLRNEFVPVARVRKRLYMQREEVLRALLSRIGDCSRYDCEAMIEDAAAHVLRVFPRLDTVDMYVSLARDLIRRPELAFMFHAGALGRLELDMSLVTAFGHTRRIDRLIVASKEATAVVLRGVRDEEDESAQRSLLHETCRVLAAMYPGRRVRGMFLFLDSVALETVCEENVF